METEGGSVRPGAVRLPRSQLELLGAGVHGCYRQEQSETCFHVWSMYFISV